MSYAGGNIGAERAAAWFADPDAIAEWAERAPVGATFVYARAPALPKDCGAAAAAARLHAMGLAEPHLRREGGRLSYVLRRVQQRIDARPEIVRAMSGGDARIYRLLADCADAGGDCPTNAALARAAGLRHGSQASYHIHRLIELGKIERTLRGDGARVIRIVATGEEIVGQPSWFGAEGHRTKRGPQ